jgi:hypothetical protein
MMARSAAAAKCKAGTWGHRQGRQIRQWGGGQGVGLCGGGGESRGPSWLCIGERTCDLRALTNPVRNKQLCLTGCASAPSTPHALAGPQHAQQKTQVPSNKAASWHCSASHLGTIAQHDSHPAAPANAQGCQMARQPQHMVKQLAVGGDVGALLWVTGCGVEAVHDGETPCMLLICMREYLPDVQASS